jgi:hypothetical protein
MDGLQQLTRFRDGIPAKRATRRKFGVVFPKGGQFWQPAAELAGIRADQWDVKLPR